MGFIEWEPFLEHAPYLGVFLVLLMAGMGMPLPEDIPLLTAGYLVHAGYARLYPMIVVTMVGVLSGDCILFFLGRLFGHHVVELRFMKRLVNPARLLRAEQLFARHGVKIIFCGRFMPGLRPMIFMAAGVLKVPPITFLLVDGFAALISVPTLVYLGKIFGDNLPYIEGELRRITHLVVIGVALAALIGLGIYWHRRQDRLAETSPELKDIDAQTLARTPPLADLSHDHQPPSSADVRPAREAAPP